VAIARPVENRELTQEEIQDIANLIARYSKTQDNKIDVKYHSPEGKEGIILGKRIEEELLENWRI